MNTKNSRISGFYKKSTEERRKIIQAWLASDVSIQSLLDGTDGLSLEQATHMIENVIGIYSLPLGIATNFQINGQDHLIPLVIEEPSVVAALSNAAKLFRAGGGFTTHSDEPLMIGQIQVLDIDDLDMAEQQIHDHKLELLRVADEVGGSIVSRGGGARDIETRKFRDTRVGAMLIIHLIYDTRDAMGANAINTAVEHLAPSVESITGGRVNLRILSNLTDKRKAYASGVIPASVLARDGQSGDETVKGIVEAGVFAEVDPYRATTHNKGIMNGIDAVILATGNDWRAIEAGAHAYAARRGSYTSLTTWTQTASGDLEGRIEVPMAVGTVGGATRVHPTAQLAMQILGDPDSRRLAEICAAVGLAQNFAAIYALATDGIQRGHMRMHARQLAVAAGAPADHVLAVAQQLIEEGNIRLARAQEIVQALENKDTDDE